MLIIKIYATREVPIREGESAEKGQTHRTELEPIDEIQIQNRGQRDSELWNYEIVKPPVLGKVIHKRADGYMPLLKKALGILIGTKRGI